MAPGALLVVLAGALVMAMPPAQSTIDRESGIAFPATFTPPGGAAQQLTGTATRAKTIFRIKVYAYGLYVEPVAARARLKSFSGRPVDALDRDPAFYQRLLAMDIPMTLRLVMARDVQGAALGQAFDDALKPRVAATPAASQGLDGPAALTAFRGYFNLQEAARGMEIVFSCGDGGRRLTTSVNGELRPPIDSAALCRALFDVYLGSSPVSAAGRRSLISGLPSILAASALESWPVAAPSRSPDRATN